MGIKTEVGFFDGKGKLLFQQDDDRTYYTDRLCENSCESCAGGIQMKPCNQKQISEKKPERIGSVIGGAAVVFAVISAILFIVMITFAHPISVLMQAPAEAVSLTTSYVRICGSGIFFIVA